MAENLVAFCGSSVLVRGARSVVTAAAAAKLAEPAADAILVFEEGTGRQVDLNYRSSRSLRMAAVGSSGPGRPKLGVIGREVTLLPRHWEWLSTQSGGASVMLRKLVEGAMRTSVESDATRHRQEACYRFMTAIAGNMPGYEEALRRLFAGSKEGFLAAVSDWPEDIREFAIQLGFAD